CPSRRQLRHPPRRAQARIHPRRVASETGSIGASIGARSLRMSKPEEHAADAKQPGLPEVDVNEYGGKRDGVRQQMNRRLFMQLLVIDAPPGGAGGSGDELAKRAADELRRRKVQGVVYADAMNPRGVGVLTWSEDPAHFVRAVRPIFATESLARAEL